MACSAATHPGLSAGTASPDSESVEFLLLADGWLTTAAELLGEAELQDALLALI